MSYLKPAQFKKFTAQISELKSAIRNEQYDLETCDFPRLTTLKAELKMLEEEFNAKAQIVKVSFNIGCRSYYEDAYKVGKFYYTVSTMTKLTSYYSPVEIKEVTKEMKDEMIADSYYY